MSFNYINVKSTDLIKTQTLKELEDYTRGSYFFKTGKKIGIDAVSVDSSAAEPLELFIFKGKLLMDFGLFMPPAVYDMHHMRIESLGGIKFDMDYPRWLESQNKIKITIACYSVPDDVLINFQKNNKNFDYGNIEANLAFEKYKVTGGVMNIARTLLPSRQATGSAYSGIILGDYTERSTLEGLDDNDHNLNVDYDFKNFVNISDAFAPYYRGGAPQNRFTLEVNNNFGKISYFSGKFNLNFPIVKPNEQGFGGSLADNNLVKLKIEKSGRAVVNNKYGAGSYNTKFGGKNILVPAIQERDITAKVSNFDFRFVE